MVRRSNFGFGRMGGSNFGFGMMDGLSLNIDVTGSTLVCAGDIIGVIIPNTAANIEGNDTEDSLFKGNFLIKTLRHDFDMGESRRHSMHMQVVKDSITKNIPSPSNNFEPKQKLENLHFFLTFITF